MEWTVFFLRGAIAAFSVMPFLHPEAAAADRQLEVNWTGLGPHVTSRRVTAVLSDGVTVQGKVISVKPTALGMRVEKTSSLAQYHGTVDVPRSLFTNLQVSRRGWKWRVIGTIAGFAGGGALGGAIGGRVDPHGFIISDGAAIGIVVGATGGAGVGYLAGHFADRHTTVIRIVE
jgi:hypothetical protein